MRTGTFPEPEGLDGILSILGGWGTRPEFSDFVRKTVGVPVVDMHADEAATIPAGRVLADNIALGRLAAEHFLERGFANMLFCCRSLRDWSVREREHGFRTRLRESGLKADTFECYPRAVKFTFTARHCVDLLASQLAATRKPLAVFVENDDFALMVLDACGRSNLKVPEDVALLGCGNDPMVVDFAPIPLSSVDLGFLMRSYQAAKLLDRLMAGKPLPKKPTRIKPAGVILRRSTDILAVEDAHLSQALSMIRLRFSDASLYPQAVAKACGMNLCTLNRSISKHLGRSIAEDIRQVRLRHARMLLSTTGLSITAIAAQSGFANLLHFRRTLQRDLCMSPRQWRAAHSIAPQPLISDP
jgi:LacI family transcriptional regulator